MRKNGFTLIEIIVAVTIVALLSVVATTGIRKQRERSADVATIDQAVTLGNALDQYYATNQGLPVISWGPVSSNLSFLETQGFLTNIPSKLSNTTGSFGPTDSYCYNYMAFAPANITNSKNGQVVGKRNWGIIFTTYQPALDSNNTNPLSDRVLTFFATPDSTPECDGTKAGSLIYGATP